MGFSASGFQPNMLPLTLKGGLTNRAHQTFFNKTLPNRSGANDTFSLLTKTPLGIKRFAGLRVRIKNNEAGSVTLTKCIVAVTANASNPFVPTTGNTLTEDGATGFVSAVFSGSNSSIVIPAPGADPAINVGSSWSDIIPISSIDPDDFLTTGDSRPYVMIRTYYPTGLWTAVGLQSDSSADYTHPNWNICTRHTGDAVTSHPQTTYSITSVAGVFEIEFLTDQQMLRIPVFGDSITQGLQSRTNGSDYNSWVQRLNVKFAKNGLPINLVNVGYSGATTTQILGFAKTYITDCKPPYALYSVFSPNDFGSPTVAGVNAQYLRALQFADFALANGCQPIFLFLAPSNETSYRADNDILRQQLIAKCKLGTIPVLDLTPAVGDGQSPLERFRVGYNFDLDHPNDVGYDSMATWGYPFFQSLVYRTFHA